VTSAFGPSHQRTHTRDVLWSPRKDTSTESGPYRVRFTWYPARGVTDMICTSPEATQLTTSPPSVWKVRPNPLAEGTHVSGGELRDWLVSEGAVAGPAVALDWGVVAGGVVAGGVVGAAPCSSVADSGRDWAGAVAIMTELIASQATPAVTAVATAQAIR